MIRPNASAPAPQEIIETNLPGGGECRHDMAVRERAADFEAALAGRHQPVACGAQLQGRTPRPLLTNACRVRVFNVAMAVLPVLLPRPILKG
jgi:hypothetical protein